MAEGKITSLSTTLVAQMQAGGTARSALTGVTANGWFGPAQPMAPVAPRGTGGRLFDYPFGANMQYTPRSSEPVTFDSLRALADNLPILRAVIETRKDQIAGLPFSIRLVVHDDSAKAKKQKATDAQANKIREIKQFLRRPDRNIPFETWLRALLEDMLVIDAATIYPRPTLGGGVYSLDAIDGSTIKPLIDQNGRRPEAPDPAFQQVLKGVVAANFTQDELLYLPRNVRTNKIYGFSPVEQVIMTINIALRRDTSTLEYYRSGTVPDSFGTLPKEWTSDQIKQFQEYFDNLMMGNTQARRGMRFMPSDFKYQESRTAPLKDHYDEWLARLICYVFSVPVTPFVSQVNRATAETQRSQANDEGLVPLQNWIKHFMDHIIQVMLGEPDLEFAWSNSAMIDPVQQMTELTGYVAAGVYNRDEVRDRLGEDAVPDGAGKDYTVSGAPLNPARLQTPEEKQADAEQQMAMLNAKTQNTNKDNSLNNNLAEGKNTQGKPKVPNDKSDLGKTAESAAHQPRDYHGRFASTGASSAGGSKDSRPRDQFGRFINNGGSSRGYTADAKRRRLLEGVKNSAERATIGGIVLGGALLVQKLFPLQSSGANFAVKVARYVGGATLIEAASHSVLSVMDYLQVPRQVRDLVETTVHVGLGFTALAEAADAFEGFTPPPEAKGNMAERTKAMREWFAQNMQNAKQTAAAGAAANTATSSVNKPPARTSQGSTYWADDRPVLPQAGRVVYGSRPAPDPNVIVPEAPAKNPALPPPSKGLPAPWWYNLGVDKSASSRSLSGVMDAVQTVLYETGQDVIEGMKAKITKDASEGSTEQLTAVNHTLDAVLREFLDRVDALGSVGHPDGGDHGSAKDHPVEDNAAKLAKDADDDGISPELREFLEYLDSVFEEKDAAAKDEITQRLQKLSAEDRWRFTEGGDPNNRLTKASKKKAGDTVNWTALEPMWQPSAHENRSVRKLKKTLTAVFGQAKTDAAEHVRTELTKLGKVNDPDPKIEALAQKIAAGVPLDALSDAASTLSDVSEQAAREVADGALVRVGLGDDEGLVNRVSDRAVAIARERAAELVGMKWNEETGEYVANPNAKLAITDSTRDMIRTIISDGLANNLSADDIAEQIESSLAFSTERSDLIAKTEIARVNSDAALEAYGAAQDAGVQIKKKWIIAAQDVCDDCTLNSKQEPIDLDQAFQSGDQSPPAHPNCRCAIAPVVYLAEGVSADDDSVQN